MCKTNFLWSVSTPHSQVEYGNLLKVPVRVHRGHLIKLVAAADLNRAE